MADSKNFIRERALIVSKLMHLKTTSGNLSGMDLDFLINYFQFQEDIKKTYIFYPVKIEKGEITFKKGLLFGKNKQRNIERFITSNIVGMMYFYARFNKDMTFGSSKKLRVNIFLDPENDGADASKNISHIKSLGDLHSPLLRKICEKYISAHK